MRGQASRKVTHGPAERVRRRAGGPWHRSQERTERRRAADRPPTAADLGGSGCLLLPSAPLVRPQSGRRHVRWQQCVKCVARARRWGMSVSHSHRRTKRRWNPNIQRVRALVSGTPKRVYVCTGCIKSRQDRQGRPEAPPMQGVIKSYDPATGDGFVLTDTDLSRVRPRRAMRSRAPSSACCARASGSCSTSTPTGAPRTLRLGSEVDMGTPGLPVTDRTSAPHRLARPRPRRSSCAATTTNERLQAWVDDWAAILQPDAIVLVRRLRRGVRPAVPAARRRRHLHQARRRQAPEQLLGPLRPGRRRPRRGPHVHLLASARTTPARPTTGGPRPRCAPS